MIVFDFLLIKLYHLYNMPSLPTGLSEAETHALLSDALIAPIPNTYRFEPAKKAIYELEHQAFDEHELSQKAIELSIAVRRLVGGQLLPASSVVMEQCAEDYAHKQAKQNTARSERIAGHYKIGSMIGLGAAGLTVSMELVGTNDIRMLLHRSSKMASSVVTPHPKKSFGKPILYPKKLSTHSANK